MIVWVLLVSNSLGCCLAAGRSLEHPWEFDTNNTHEIMFDPLNFVPHIYIKWIIPMKILAKELLIWLHENM